MTSLNKHHRIRVGGNGYRGAVLRDNPASYWPLDEATGTVAVDVLGANDGTYTPNDGVNWTDGSRGTQPGPVNRETGGAAASNGFTGYISLPDAAIPLNLYGTLEAWVKGTDASGGILERYASAAGARLIMYLGQVVCTVGTTVLAPQAFSGASYRADDNAWHHVAGTWDDTTIRVYLDGVLRGSVSRGAPWQSGVPTTPSAGNTRIFRSTDQGYLGNRLAHVACYGDLLSAAAINAHYLAGINGS